MTADLTPKPQRSNWLIMVYLAGDNNLSPYSIAFLQQLEEANKELGREEANKYARVVAAYDSPTPLPKGARYLEIKRHQKKDPLKEDEMAFTQRSRRKRSHRCHS